MSELLKTRIKPIAKSAAEGKCVLYVMSRDQRVRDNHALLAAQKHALAKNLPLCVVFVLYEKSGFRAREHYQFMLKGLQQVEKDLADLNISFMCLLGNAQERIQGLVHHTKPDAVYFDFNPLRGPKNLASKLTFKTPKEAPWVFVVDTHNVVPVWVASDKKEVGAYTLRPKLHKVLQVFSCSFFATVKRYVGSVFWNFTHQLINHRLKLRQRLNFSRPVN